MVSLIWLAIKNVYISTEQHGDIKSGVAQSKNATILQAQCDSGLSCSNMRKSSYPRRHEKCDRFASFFVTATVKLQTFVINKPDFSPSEQGIPFLSTYCYIKNAR